MSYAPNEYVLFDDINTYEDLGLLKVTDEIGYPQPVGSLDELARYGLIEDQYDIEYSRRALQFEFRKIDTEPFPDFVTYFSGLIHGKKVKIVRSIDPDYFFLGRVSVNKYKTVKETGTLVVDVDAEPFKYGNRVTETINETTGATLTINTAYPTPTVIEITPTTAVSSMTMRGVAFNRITGADEPITLKNLSSGTKIVVDGEKKTIKSGNTNRFSDAEVMWEYPSFRSGGKKYVSFTSNRLNVSVSYNPRYV